MPRHIKQVRFALKNIVYPSETAISAIAVSLSSGSSTLTPGPYPSKKYGRPGPTPYVLLCNPRPKLPESIKYADRHPLLKTSALSYDLRDPTPTATTTHKNHPLSIETLHEPAFIPPLSHITITSSYLPWTIKVAPSSSPCITIQDILTSIYSALRTNITSTEFQLLPSDHDRKRAIHAYERRYRRLQRRIRGEFLKASQAEKRGGMKRVDFLMGYTKFLGISRKGSSNDEWNLRVGSSTSTMEP